VVLRVEGDQVLAALRDVYVAPCFRLIGHLFGASVLYFYDVKYKKKREQTSYKDIK